MATCTQSDSIALSTSGFDWLSWAHCWVSTPATTLVEYMYLSQPFTSPRSSQRRQWFSASGADVALTCSERGANLSPDRGDLSAKPLDRNDVQLEAERMPVGLTFRSSFVPCSCAWAGRAASAGESVVLMRLPQLFTSPVRQSDLHSRRRRGKDGKDPCLLGLTIRRPAIPVLPVAPKGASGWEVTVKEADFAFGGCPSVPANTGGSVCAADVNMATHTQFDNGLSIREDVPCQCCRIGWWVKLTRDPERYHPSEFANLRLRTSSPQRFSPAMRLASNSICLDRLLLDDRAGGHCLRAPPHPQLQTGRAGLVDTSPARTFLPHPIQNMEYGI